jgi:hypothetical protein
MLGVMTCTEGGDSPPFSTDAEFFFFFAAL